MIPRRFQSALRFAVVSDLDLFRQAVTRIEFQSALRFAVVSDTPRHQTPGEKGRVSIRFKVRGGFRPSIVMGIVTTMASFQSALRFAVVSDPIGLACFAIMRFQSALRFAVVSDLSTASTLSWTVWVSIRFKVRGGFRRDYGRRSLDRTGFNPL